MIFLELLRVPSIVLSVTNVLLKSLKSRSDRTANRLYLLSLPASYLFALVASCSERKPPQRNILVCATRASHYSTSAKSFPLCPRRSEDFNSRILLYNWGNDLSGNTDGLSVYLRDAGGQIYRLTSSHRFVISDRFELCYYKTRATGCQQTAWLRRRWTSISEESHMVGGHGYASHWRGC